MALEGLVLKPSSTMSETSDFKLKTIPSETQLRPCYRVVMKKGKDGWIVVKCLDVKGAISQGKDKNEALRNIIEAISAILEDIKGESPEFSVLVVEEK